MGIGLFFESHTDKCFWAIDHEIFLKTYIKVPNTVNTFVKKVYEVECIEFKSLEERDIIEVLNFVGYKLNRDAILTLLQRDEMIDEIKKQGYISINTLEGVEKLYPTEILIRGVEGEYYPVKLVNFNKVYEVIQ